MDAALLLQHTQYAVPVGIVLVLAVLVFAFGFKNAEQPPFGQLSAVADLERKQAGKKRVRTREKRSANGQVTSEKASPGKKASPAKAESVKKSSPKNEDIDGKLKERKQNDEEPILVTKKKTPTAPKPGKENKVEQKNKKNAKNLIQEKPVDYDDGDWEQAYSRKDKKNKKKEEDTPSKKSKKSSKKAEIVDDGLIKEKEFEKVEIKDKVAKETENKELKEKDKKEVVLTPIIDGNSSKEEEPEVKDELINKSEKIEKEEKKSKSKKGKKRSEGENSPPGSNPVTPKKEQKVSEKVIEKLPEKKVEEVKKDKEIKEVKEDKDIEEINEVKEIKEVEVPKVPIIENPSGKGGVMFDELGDAWTEAKPQKKIKKKARREN
ncbi:uncharacterized protein PF11_0207 [Orussus abietinus]|uniref:uncharacterized protein PF11_0207 n=1 Tax=Orussus abietinus TaxID=222816 RepID=UPI000625118D|nr:uncharacterized protein PF11_0207 [Orussus abietinus]